jgi:hypothetical protein
VKVHKVPRWVVLLILVVILGALLTPPGRLSTKPQSATTLEKNASSFQSKLGELEEAHQQGQQGAEVRLTSDEVGAALIVANSPTPATQPGVEGSASKPPELTPKQVPVKDPQVIFEGDEVKGQFSAQVYGKDMLVTLTGHLGAKDGYVTFNPTSFKIGSMPMPISLVQAQLDKKFSEPEAREKLKLPDFVSDLRIENGELVIVEK